MNEMQRPCNSPDTVPDWRIKQWMVQHKQLLVLQEQKKLQVKAVKLTHKSCVTQEMTVLYFPTEAFFFTKVETDEA